MNSTATHHTDEQIPIFEVSDEAMEIAGGSMREKAGTFTMAFCSSVNSCPLIASTHLAVIVRAPSMKSTAIGFKR